MQSAGGGQVDQRQTPSRPRKSTSVPSRRAAGRRAARLAKSRVTTLAGPLQPPQTSRVFNTVREPDHCFDTHLDHFGRLRTAAQESNRTAAIAYPRLLVTWSEPLAACRCGHRTGADPLRSISELSEPTLASHASANFISSHHALPSLQHGRSSHCRRGEDHSRPG